MRLLFLLCLGVCWAEPIPISFSIPECKIVEKIPEKTKDFAFIIPGRGETYIYTREEDYYKDYQSSYYGITSRKGGWDCLRHYEILANGCIPYFVDLDSCNEKTLAFFPKKLIKEAMNLEGVSCGQIDHSKFDKTKYFAILQKLLDYTRQHLTTRQMASYLLNKVNYNGRGKILFLSGPTSVDYQRCLTLIGLKEILGHRVIDFPKIPHIYKSFAGDLLSLYGRGMSCTRILYDLAMDRTHMEERIANKEFDLIIYGSAHRGTPFLDLVRQTYDSSQIVYICGEDEHHCGFRHLPNFFLREFQAAPFEIGGSPSSRDRPLRANFSAPAEIPRLFF